MSLKFLRLVPIQQLEGAWLGDPIKTPRPPPPLTKNFVNVRANVENIFFYVCMTVVFFMETGSKLELKTVNLSTQFHQ